MFSFLRQHKSHQTGAGSIYSRDDASTLAADDATEVGSIVGTREYTSSEKSGAPAIVRFGKHEVPLASIHPDFRNAGDYVVFSSPEDLEALDSRTYFKVHYRTMIASLGVINLEPVDSEVFMIRGFKATPRTMDTLLRFIHEMHPGFPAPKPWTATDYIEVYQMLHAYVAKDHIMKSFWRRLTDALPGLAEALGLTPSYDKVFGLLRLAFWLAKSHIMVSKTPAANILMRAAVKQAHKASKSRGLGAKKKNGRVVSGWELLYSPYRVPPELYADAENAKVWDMCLAIVRFRAEHKVLLSLVRVTVAEALDEQNMVVGIASDVWGGPTDRIQLTL